MHIFSAFNIILVQQETKLAWEDLRDIATYILAKSNRLKVQIISPRYTADVLPHEIWQLPTMTVSFGPTGRFNPPRGPVFVNRPVSKLDQASRLAAAGIPTPRTAPFKFGMPLDPGVWGDFVVLKPASLRLTSKSEGIYLFRTERLNTLRATDLTPRHMARQAQMLVQRFVDTGEKPAKQRITTLFGEPFHWAYSANRSARPPLTSSDELLDAASISTSASGDRDWSYEVPSDDMINLARQVGAAFPNIPLLGLDLLRCHATGQAYVLEINAGGNVWHYSSRMAAAERVAHPENFPTPEFKKWSFEKAADILITKAISDAR
jgi:hypothetical protein